MDWALQVHPLLLSVEGSPRVDPQLQPSPDKITHPNLNSRPNLTKDQTQLNLE